MSVIDPSCGWSAGGMISTLEDMKTWAVALGTGSLLTPEAQAERLSIGIVFTAGSIYFKYCLGGTWMGENVIFGHNSEIFGFTSAVFHMPSKQAVFVVLSNCDYTNTLSVIASISKIVYPDDVPW
ncbi:MAG: serine hydrolase [Vulcanimicrobiota bacterium]